jgi:hypothetical protein
MFVEDGRLEAAVRSAVSDSGMGTTDRHEELQGPLVGTVAILAGYRVSSSTAAIMAYSLAGVRTVRG